MEEGSRKAIVAAFLANLGIALAKFVGFALTRSASMLAEGIHSLADTGNQALLFMGGRRAARPANSIHPYGHGRERYFWAFAVALVLFSMGGLFALYEGIDKFRNPHEPDDLGIAIAILLVALVLEGLSLRTGMAESRRLKPAGMSWWGFIHRTKQPELPVVLLEDSGACVGLLFAIGGVVMSAVTGDARWDALGSIAIGLLLIAIAVVLMLEMKSLLIGEGAAPDVSAAIGATIESTHGVTKLIHVRTEHLAPDEILVTTKVELERTLSYAEVVATIDRIEDAVRAAVPQVAIMYVEPDIFRADRA